MKTRKKSQIRPDDDVDHISEQISLENERFFEILSTTATDGAFSNSLTAAWLRN